MLSKILAIGIRAAVILVLVKISFKITKHIIKAALYIVALIIALRLVQTIIVV